MINSITQFLISSIVALVFVSCGNHINHQEVEKTNNISISSKLMVNTDGLVLCSHAIKPFSKMRKYDCAFTLDNVHYNIRHKYLFDAKGQYKWLLELFA